MPKKAMLGKGAPGLGGAKYHRKVMRDNLNAMTKPMYQRMGRRAGIVRFDGNVYEELRGITMKSLNNLLQIAVNLMVHQRMRTLTFNHIIMAYQMHTGKTFMGGKHTANHKPPYIHKETGFKNRTIALREIRAHQRNSDRAIIPYMPFDRLCREICQDLGDEIPRFEEAALYTLRFLLEDYLVDLLYFANEIALDNGRFTVTRKDIQIVRRIRGE